MTDKESRPGAGKAHASEDAWDRLARSNRAEARGEDPLEVLVGDTARHLRRERTEAMQIEGPGPSSEILELVNASLASEPERVDLWTMRFEVQKALGLKAEFAEALARAFGNPRLRRALDWSALRALWEEVAPGEALPEGVQLPGPAAPAAAPPPRTAATATARDRRFSDVAHRIAARELAVLAKAYAALQARPGFHEEFARRVAPLLNRPTLLQPAANLDRINSNPNARIFLKREDGRAVTPEQENAAAQCHVAALMGRPTVITGNDVDAHALAVAEGAPRFGLRCIVVVRPADLADKPVLVERLRACGAQVEAMAMAGAVGTDPREGALRLWLDSMGSAHLALSLGTGPSPYPAMVNTFRSLLGRETDAQLRAVSGDGRQRTLVAAVHGEADSIGFMLPQLGRSDVELMYAEPDPGGVASWRPGARLRAYNGAIREHAWLRGLNRIEHVSIPDAQAQAALRQAEGAEQITLGLEDARAVALACLLSQRDRAPRDYVVLVG